MGLADPRWMPSHGSPDCLVDPSVLGDFRFILAKGQCLGKTKDNVSALKNDNVLVLKKDNVMVLKWDDVLVLKKDNVVFL